MYLMRCSFPEGKHLGWKLAPVWSLHLYRNTLQRPPGPQPTLCKPQLKELGACESSHPSQAVNTQGRGSYSRQMKHKRHSSPSPNRAGHSPKLRKTSFAWIAGQSLTRNGMATYTPSNQIISLRNRNHNPYRLRKEGKKRKKERPEYSRNFMNGLSQRSACLVLWKTTSFILQTKLTWSRWRRLSCLRAAGAKQAVSWWHAPSRRGRETPLWSHSKPLCNSLLCFFFPDDFTDFKISGETYHTFVSNEKHLPF